MNKKYFYIIKLIITILILYFLFQLLDYNKIKNAITFSDKKFLLLSVLILPFWIILRSLKWKILLSYYWPQISFSLASKSYLGGLGPGLLTPAKLGEISRAYFLPYKNKYKIIKIMILDRYIELVVLLILTIPGFIYFIGIDFGFFIIILSILGLFSCFHFFKIFGKINKIFPKIRWIKNNFKADNQNIFFPKMLITKSILLSALIFSTSIFTSYLLVNSFLSIKTIDIGDAFFVFPLTLLTNILPITVGNLGVREAVTILLLNDLSVSKEAAFNSSIILFLLHSIFPALIGLILIQFKK